MRQAKNDMSKLLNKSKNRNEKITDYLSELNAKIRLLPTDLKWLFY
jgi:hypothetical protein